MHIVTLVGTLVGVVGLTGGALWGLFSKLDHYEEKLNLMGVGIQILMEEMESLDAERFKQALDENGFNPDDFKKD